MVEAFRDWIQSEMEQRLDQLENLHFDDSITSIKIAITTFAFKNADVINLLKARGKLIKEEKWDKMAKMDD